MTCLISLCSTMNLIMSLYLLGVFCMSNFLYNASSYSAMTFSHHCFFLGFGMDRSIWTFRRLYLPAVLMSSKVDMSDLVCIIFASLIKAIFFSFECSSL